MTADGTAHCKRAPFPTLPGIADVLSVMLKTGKLFPTLTRRYPALPNAAEVLVVILSVSKFPFRY